MTVCINSTEYEPLTYLHIYNKEYIYFYRPLPSREVSLSFLSTRLFQYNCDDTCKFNFTSTSEQTLCVHHSVNLYICKMWPTAEQSSSPVTADEHLVLGAGASLRNMKLKVLWMCDAKAPYSIDRMVYTRKQLRENAQRNLVKKCCPTVEMTNGEWWNKEKARNNPVLQQNRRRSELYGWCTSTKGKKQTWPMVFWHNMLDVSTLNVPPLCVLLFSLHSPWMSLLL